mgnify:FL=1
MGELTNASFFSGVGGLDLGLERAGWRTVSFSEIDPYACAVLAQRWPGVPNLGDIIPLAAREGGRQSAGVGRVEPWHGASLWSGGFPCQDLSVAGKRRGMGAGTRSGLAYAFLDLVAVHRPRAVLLENVPGLLSSHGGRDMAPLLGAMGELGYGVGYRMLDARHFGVPQRRRRVFILGLTPGGRAGAERAAEVLSVGSRCRRHPPTGVKAGPGAAAGARPGVDIARTVVGTAGKRHDEDIDTLVPTVRSHSSSPDSDRMRAPDELAGRLDDRGGVVNALDTKRGGADDNEAQAGHLIAAFTKSHNVAGPDDPERWTTGREARVGLDSHRYRCCGNGVVSDVAEWIGLRLAEALR